MGQPEGFEYIHNFLPFSEHMAVLNKVRNLHYEHEMFRGRLMKRAWAQFGYSYKAAARKVKPALRCLRISRRSCKTQASIIRMISPSPSVS